MEAADQQRSGSDPATQDLCVPDPGSLAALETLPALGLPPPVPAQLLSRDRGSSLQLCSDSGHSDSRGRGTGHYSLPCLSQSHLSDSSATAEAGGIRNHTCVSFFLPHQDGTALRPARQTGTRVTTATYAHQSTLRNQAVSVCHRSQGPSSRAHPPSAFILLLILFKDIGLHANERKPMSNEPSSHLE